MKSNIYLVRHAQSESNVNHLVLQSRTNVGIHLTPQGVEQAKETGQFLLNEFQNMKNYYETIKVWNSPYERTRETAHYIKESLSNLKKIHTILEEESIHIAEKQFGLLDDALDYEVSHSVEFSHYMLHRDEQKEFFARPPLGESSFDMCQRLDFFLRCVIAQEPNVLHVVVSHGAALRGLIMMNDKLTYEKYLEMTNPYNASVHHLNGEKGYVGQLFVPTLKSL